MSSGNTQVQSNHQDANPVALSGASDHTAIPKPHAAVSTVPHEQETSNNINVSHETHQSHVNQESGPVSLDPPQSNVHSHGLEGMSHGQIPEVEQHEDDQVGEEPPLSLDLGPMPFHDMAPSPPLPNHRSHNEGNFNVKADVPVTERPRTPLRQYLVDMIGEEDVQELEAVDDRGGDETDDDFRFACAMMSEGRSDLQQHNDGGLFNDHNTTATVHNDKVDKMHQQSVKNNSIPQAGPEKNKVNQKGPETEKKTSRKNSRGTKKLNPMSMSKEERLRMAVERMKQSATYWKEEPVEDERLAGWCIHLCKRSTGDHCDKYWLTPAGLKLRSKLQVEKFLQAVQETNGDEDEAYKIVMGRTSRSARAATRLVTGATSKDAATTTTAAGSVQRRRRTASSTKRSSTTVKDDSNGKRKVFQDEASSTNVATQSPQPTKTRPKRQATDKSSSPIHNGIDYSMTSAVQSASATKKKLKVSRKRKNATKHTSAAKATKRVKKSAPAIAASIMPHNSYRVTQIVSEEGIVTNESAASQSVIFDRIRRMKKNVTLHVPYRLEQVHDTSQVAEPKTIEVRKASKKKAAKGVAANLPVTNVDIPAVAESK